MPVITYLKHPSHRLFESLKVNKLKLKLEQHICMYYIEDKDRTNFRECLTYNKTNSIKLARNSLICCLNNSKNDFHTFIHICSITKDFSLIC